MTRREVLEHLVHVLGIREPQRLRRLTREYLGYQARMGLPTPVPWRRATAGEEL